MSLSPPVPLTADHNLIEFDCGNPALGDWLRHRALRNESRFSRTYVVCADKRVVAFYSLSAGAVERQMTPGNVRRNAPETIPVAVIGRLAVDMSLARRGLGADLLADALKRIAVAAQTIGIAAVLVQAKDEAARKYYLARAEFVEFPTDSRVLFLPVGMVAAGLK